MVSFHDYLFLRVIAVGSVWEETALVGLIGLSQFETQ